MGIAEAVFGIILTLRLLVPLTIPRFPLPGVFAGLVIDGVDGYHQYRRYEAARLATAHNADAPILAPQPRPGTS